MQWVGFLASLFTLIGIPIAIIKSNPESSTLVLALFLSILTAVCLFALVVEEFRWHRKARYAEAQEHLHQAFHRVRDCWWLFMRGQNRTTIHERLEESLQGFAAASSLITGVHCRACIQQIFIRNANADPIERGLLARCLCRSEESGRDPGNEANDWVSENTDFLYLFRNPGEMAFVGQDLVAMLARGYRNTHWTDEVIRDERFDYRAAIIWPIRKRTPGEDEGDIHLSQVTCPLCGAQMLDEGAEGIHPTQDIFGYLCVDTMARHAFLERFDKPMGAAFADTLYPLLIALNRQQKEAIKANALPSDGIEEETTKQ